MLCWTQNLQQIQKSQQISSLVLKLVDFMPNEGLNIDVLFQSVKIGEDFQLTDCRILFEILKIFQTTPDQTLLNIYRLVLF